MKATTKSILRFMLRSTLIVSTVIVPLAIWYVIEDPYQVLRHYDTYFPNYEEYPVRIGMNKGVATFSNLQDRMREGYSYNAFIFGSSISCYYDADTWARLIIKKAGERDVRPYHLDSALESLESMAHKAKYIDKLGIPLDYALVILDPIIMGEDGMKGPAYEDAPQLHENILEAAKYHYTFFRSAANADFFKSFIPAKIEGEPIDNGRNMIFEQQPIAYNPITNQENIPLWDSLISANPQEFYENHKLITPPFQPKISKITLNAYRIKALEQIAEVFKRHNTSYQIIIGPNRHKVMLNPQDLKILQSIFGAESVHDYSQELIYLLEPDTAMYDNTHYRPYVARILMERTYL